MAQMTENDDRIAKCNKILEANPNSQIFAALADAYRKKGEVDKAFRICQAGLKTHLNYGSAHVVMAKINLDKGLYDWAEMEANKAIDIDGPSRVTDILLAEICIYRGELVKASGILNSINDIDPGNEQVMELLALVARLGAKSPVNREAERAEDAANSGANSEPGNEIGDSDASIKNEEKVSIEKLLDKIITIKGIQGVLIIDEDGLVSEERWNDNTSGESCAVMASEIVKFMAAQIGFVKYGNLHSLLIEAQDYIINIIPIEYQNMLLIKAEPRTNLGSIKLKVNPLLEKLDYNI